MILRNNELRFLLQDRQIKKRQEEKRRFEIRYNIYDNVYERNIHQSVPELDCKQIIPRGKNKNLQNKVEQMQV